MASQKAPSAERIDWDNITNSQIEFLITEYIHSQRDRDILRRRLIDGLTYEKLAFEFDISVRQMKRIVSNAEGRLFKHT